MTAAASWCLRRLVLAPLMPVLALVSVVVEVVAVPVSLIVCLALALAHESRPRWRFLRVNTAVAVYLLCETVCLVACLLLWVATGFGWRLRAGWSVRAHRMLLERFLDVVLATFRRVFGFQVRLLEPENRPADVLRAHQPAPIVVLARHAGPGASFALIHELVSRYHRDLTVVLKDQLRLDPSVDLLLTRTGCTWIPKAHSRGDHSADRVGEAARALTGAGALLLFPEGADWTPLRQVQAVARLRGRGRVAEARQALRMPHVLPPRPAGTLAALSNAPQAEVLIFTHTGHDQLLDAASSWAALPLAKPLQMTWWRADRDQLPEGNENAVAEWLRTVWSDIDAWIEERQLLTAVQGS